jgi:signal transduction histidine kinase
MTMPLSSTDALVTRATVLRAAEVDEFLAGADDWLAGVITDCADGAVHEVTFVLTELLANAAKHAPGPYTVTVIQRALVVRVEVRDEAGAGPQPWPVGKGLLVVRGLCPDWGVSDRGTSKTVWAELPILLMA